MMLYTISYDEETGQVNYVGNIESSFALQLIQKIAIEEEISKREKRKEDTNNNTSSNS